MKAKPKHYVEYFFFRLFVVVFVLLPYRGALGVAWLLAFFMHFILRFRTREARRRIRERRKRLRRGGGEAAQ